MEPHTSGVPASAAPALAKTASAAACSAGGSGPGTAVETSVTTPLLAPPPPEPDAEARAAAERAEARQTAAARSSALSQRRVMVLHSRRWASQRPDGPTARAAAAGGCAALSGPLTRWRGAAGEESESKLRDSHFGSPSARAQRPPDALMALRLSSTLRPSRMQLPRPSALVKRAARRTPCAAHASAAPAVALRLAPAALYAALAVLGVNIGASDLADTASVGVMLGYGQAGASSQLALSAVRLSGGTHFPVAGALAALGLSARARAINGADSAQLLPDDAARLLSLGLAAAVCPLALTVAAWVRMTPPGAGLPPIVCFILFRLALEASAGLAALLRPTGAFRAALRAAHDAAQTPASAAGWALWAVAAGCVGSAALALAAPVAYVALTWPGADVATLPALTQDLLPALAGAMLAAAAAAATLAGGVRAAAAERAPQPTPYLALAAGLAAMGATHAAVHAAAGAAPGAAAGAFCFVAAAAAAAELARAQRA